MSRLDILINSLEKKNQVLDKKFDSHFADVRSANGQPLNDKRNGHVTLNRWENQNNSINRQISEIEKTERAIEREQQKISVVESVKNKLPKIINELLEKGEITQWRKFPNRFFVVGVNSARLIVNLDTQIVSYSHLSEIKDKEQYSKFRDIYNFINNQHNKLI